MTVTLAQWVSILLCFSMAGALGGGLYEHIVLTPYGADRRPPRNFQRELLGGRIGPGSESP